MWLEMHSLNLDAYWLQCASQDVHFPFSFTSTLPSQENCEKCAIIECSLTLHLKGTKKDNLNRKKLHEHWPSC